MVSWRERRASPTTVGNRDEQRPVTVEGCGVHLPALPVDRRIPVLRTVRIVPHPAARQLPQRGSRRRAGRVRAEDERHAQRRRPQRRLSNGSRSTQSRCVTTGVPESTLRRFSSRHRRYNGSRSTQSRGVTTGVPESTLRRFGTGQDSGMPPPGRNSVCSPVAARLAIRPAVICIASAARSFSITLAMIARPAPPISSARLALR